MKKLSLLLLVILCLGACQKDALKVNEEKEYKQTDAPPTTDLLASGTDLVLKPDGTATILPGGDIILNATYNISGKKLTVKVRDNNTTFRFTIVSDEEIHGDGGVVLKLVKH